MAGRSVDRSSRSVGRLLCRRDVFIFVGLRQRLLSFNTAMIERSQPHPAHLHARPLASPLTCQHTRLLAAHPPARPSICPLARSSASQFAFSFARQLVLTPACSYVCPLTRSPQSAHLLDHLSCPIARSLSRPPGPPVSHCPIPARPSHACPLDRSPDHSPASSLTSPPARSPITRPLARPLARSSARPLTCSPPPARPLSHSLARPPARSLARSSAITAKTSTRIVQRWNQSVSCRQQNCPSVTTRCFGYKKHYRLHITVLPCACNPPARPPARSSHTPVNQHAHTSAVGFVRRRKTSMKPHSSRSSRCSWYTSCCWCFSCCCWCPSCCDHPSTSHLSSRVN